MQDRVRRPKLTVCAEPGLFGPVASDPVLIRTESGGGTARGIG
jgi:hypothetical protein